MSTRAVAPELSRRFRKWCAAPLLALALASAGVVAASPAPVLADSAPADPLDPETPSTVSADALPTAQINGVVWSQAMVGNTVYAGGSFTQARPAGSTAAVTRSNMLAYDVTTGVMTGFAPSFNAQVRSVAVSPDRSRIYVGGDFTSVDGVTRKRIAAFDASTGALVASFAPPVNYTVDAIVATDTTVYAGGDFLGVGSQDRQYLAAFNASNGALLSWAPQATGGTVWSLAVDPTGTKVAVGGSFTALNGSSNPGYGLGIVDAASGANLPMAANSLLRDGGQNAAITTLSTDGQYLYGGGYTYGSGGNLEGTFQATWNGDLQWLNDCHGDTYSVQPQNGVLYVASHEHYCENMGGVPENDPNGSGWYRGTAFGTKPTGTISSEPGGYANFAGQPHSSMLTWFPSINAGTYTGQTQGAWSVTGNGDYVAMGGEFTKVNGRAQQGLVRFAKPSLAPNAQGPTLFGTTYPLNVRSTQAGAVHISWRTNQDIDNDYLTYRLYRDDQVAAGLLDTRKVRARFWNPYVMGFTDSGVAPGSTHRYRVVVTDPFGNVANSPWTDVTVASSGTDSPYAKAVDNSQPTDWWRFNEGSGTSLADSSGFSGLTTTSGPVLGVPGAIPADSRNTGVRLSGSSSTRVYTSVQDTPPDVLTLEVWFRTKTGGYLVGRGDSTSGSSTKVDRQLYLNNAGQVLFGVKPNQNREVVTSPKSYTDGAWHCAAASLSPDGMKLYVDGQKVAERSDVTVGQHLDLGYWRVGGDSLAGWPSAPTNGWFNGDLDEIAVYKRALSDSEIAAHYAAATGGATPNVAPTADFSVATQGLTAQLTAQASDPDGTVAGYAWDFGDGGTSTARDPSHTYAAGGTYPVRLTVTDDKGATGSVTKQVTVSPPAPAQAFAQDGFTREVSGGWGSAETGGAWTRSGSSTNFTVTAGQGRIKMASAGSGPGMALSGVSSSDTDLRVDVGADKAATGGGTYLTAEPRLLGNGDRYYTDVRLLSDGSVALRVGRNVGGTENILASATVPGLTVAPGQLVHLRTQATGTSPTVLRAKVWAVGTSEPTAWTVSTTDSSASLQTTGAIALRTYLSGSATDVPVVGLFDDLWAGPVR